MTSIRIQCETCGAKLRVRDEGFVGEVHACPRCGSMVLIAGPDQQQSASPAAQCTLTAAMSDSLEADPTAADHDCDPALTAPAQPADAVGQAATQPSKLSAWAPLATTTVAIAATAGVLLTWAFTKPGSASPTVAASPHTESATPTGAAAIPAPEPVAEAPALTRELATEPIASPPVEPEAFAPQPIEPEPAPNLAGEPPTDHAPAAPQSPEAQPIEVEPSAPEPRVALASRNAAPTPGAEEQPVIDPLSFDPTEVELILRHGDEGADEEATATFGPPAPAPEPSVAPPSADERLDEQLADAGRRGGVYVRRGPTGPETAPSLEPADRRLQERLPNAELRDMPLADAVRLLGDIAGVSITIEPAALRRAATTPRRPIDVLGADQPLGDVLATALAPARLRFVTDGANVIVRRVDADRAKAVTHPLADLAGDNPDALASLLRAALPSLDDARVDADGGLTLNAPLATHFDLVVFCEQLRVARGLPTKSKYPRALVHDQPTLLRLAPVLGRRTTFSFVEPTPLADIVAYWRQATGLPILVDWRALADEGLGPRTPIECSVIGRPWQAALDGVLQPLNLAWGPAGGDALWLTTRSAPTDNELIELYAMPEEAAERVIENLELTDAAYDTTANRLIVRADAAGHREVWRAVSLGGGR